MLTVGNETMTKKEETQNLIELGKLGWALSTMAAASQGRNRRVFLKELFKRVNAFQTKAQKLACNGIDVTDDGRGTMTRVVDD